MIRQKMKTPILVTGAHRSGTTWVGKILAASPEVAYISEPLNVHHRPGVLRVPTHYWYSYISADNQADFLSAFRETVRFRYHPWLELKSLQSKKDAGRMLRDMGWFIGGKLRRARPLLKDPFAVFSAPWFAEMLDCQVVILIRHPLAFVSSLKRLNWKFDFRDLLAQPLLMHDHLEIFRSDMEALLDFPDDVIVQGSLLWRMIYSVVDSFSAMHPEFIMVRHEDFSRQPEAEFRELFASLEIAFTPKVRKVIQTSSQSNNPDELSTHGVHAVKLDSLANLSNWKKRLSADEIRRIRDLTADVVARFYPEESWSRFDSTT
jgi:hypothetical protein